MALPILCSSVRPWPASAPGAFADLARASGVREVEIGAGVPAADLSEGLRRAVQAGLQIPVMSTPGLPGRLGPDKRAPYLASDDPGERAAALAGIDAALQVGAGLGLACAVVDLGRLELSLPVAKLHRAFARDELAIGEDTGPWARLLAERRARVVGPLDGARFACEALGRLAERHHVVIALQLADGPHGLPSPREVVGLLAEQRGAPLGVDLAPDRLAVLAELALAPSAPLRQVLAESARLHSLASHVGLTAGLLPGLGEGAAAPDEPGLPDGVLRLVRGGPESREPEILAALAAAAR